MKLHLVPKGKHKNTVWTIAIICLALLVINFVYGNFHQSASSESDVPDQFNSELVGSTNDRLKLIGSELEGDYFNAYFTSTRQMNLIDVNQLEDGVKRCPVLEYVHFPFGGGQMGTIYKPETIAKITMPLSLGDIIEFRFDKECIDRVGHVEVGFVENTLMGNSIITVPYYFKRNTPKGKDTMTYNPLNDKVELN